MLPRAPAAALASCLLNFQARTVPRWVVGVVFAFFAPTLAENTDTIIGCGDPWADAAMTTSHVKGRPGDELVAHHPKNLGFCMRTRSAGGKFIYGTVCVGLAGNESLQRIM